MDKSLIIKVIIILSFSFFYSSVKSQIIVKEITTSELVLWFKNRKTHSFKLTCVYNKKDNLYSHFVLHYNVFGKYNGYNVIDFEKSHKIKFENIDELRQFLKVIDDSILKKISML